MGRMIPQCEWRLKRIVTVWALPLAYLPKQISTLWRSFMCYENSRIILWNWLPISAFKLSLSLYKFATLTSLSKCMSICCPDGSSIMLESRFWFQILSVYNLNCMQSSASLFLSDFPHSCCDLIPLGYMPLPQSGLFQLPLLFWSLMISIREDRTPWTKFHELGGINLKSKDQAPSSCQDVSLFCRAVHILENLMVLKY